MKNKPCRYADFAARLRLDSSPGFLISPAFPILFTPPLPSPDISSDAAVQEERQRNREREGELEFSVGVNEEMPVEKILEAETAVEQKTELHSDGGSAGNSVSVSNMYILDIREPVCYYQSKYKSSFCHVIGLVFIFMHI